eukprot:CAMPEP_0113942010 /NCGR_PEP_ID=MMETSP1339-20121228/7806_1 /TAXON_ID=94617 /ORGANISM="Fibrocapsa japonica" /LENGTH=218 /DNA_ID=CAMNT_0000946315 /DNA_START=164 /DNA_END=820 /DNA_ORIENTATION=- /assembly_acc=CAM_ASM_000762
MDTDPDWLKDEILAERVPVRCISCGKEEEDSSEERKVPSFCKPRITFFGEKLPTRFSKCREEDILTERDGRCAEKIKEHEDLQKSISFLSTRVKFGLAPQSDLDNANSRLGEMEEEKKASMIQNSPCDLMLIFGTSLNVAPAALLPDEVHWSCPRVLFNREPVHIFDEPVEFRIGGDNGFRFDREDNYRDVFVQGDCDEGCEYFANLLGWTIPKILNS